MTRSARFLGAGVALLAGVLVMPSVGDDKPGVEAKAAFAKMKTLAGEWTADVDGHGAGGGPQKVTYKVTGAGSVVMESQFPGTDHEMISMYHLDGDVLRMTHYCAAGNQPRVKYDPKASKPGELVFVFDGGTNLNPAKDMHIHGVTFVFRDAKHVDALWEGHANGKKMADTKFAMSRP
ncbi:MAG: hypothetical protein JWN86_1973 [Planctomycetota bacterium]|nr:hypothetical protein [Planctomycetota bacterium]